MSYQLDVGTIVTTANTKICEQLQTTVNANAEKIVGNITQSLSQALTANYEKIMKDRLTEMDTVFETKFFPEMKKVIENILQKSAASVIGDVTSVANMKGGKKRVKSKKFRAITKLRKTKRNRHRHQRKKP